MSTLFEFLGQIRPGRCASHTVWAVVLADMPVNSLQATFIVMVSSCFPDGDLDMSWHSSESTHCRPSKHISAFFAICIGSVPKCFPRRIWICCDPPHKDRDVNGGQRVQSCKSPKRLARRCSDVAKLPYSCTLSEKVTSSFVVCMISRQQVMSYVHVIQTGRPYMKHPLPLVEIHFTYFSICIESVLKCLMLLEDICYFRCFTDASILWRCRRVLMEHRRYKKSF